jgi:23S rRNA (uracil1939-C5)-methyltransferase
MEKLKKNTRHEINITDVDAKGFGVGRLDNLAIFVEGALPGDKLVIQIIKVKTRYAYGKVIRITEPSAHRKKDTAGICPVAAQCGGCQFQHCEYTSQLLFKKQMVINALERIGNIAEPPVLDVIGMAEPYHYRNKAVFPVGGDGIGAYAARSHRIIPVTHCNIQHPVHEPIINEIQIYIKQYNIPVYDENTHTGLLRQVMVRAGNVSDEVMAVCVINGDSLPDEHILAEKLTKAGATTVLINKHTKKGNSVLGEHFRAISGNGKIRQQIGAVCYTLSARSFFQINSVQTKILYDKALQFGGFNGNETVIDAHAGVGSIALYVARFVKFVYGVEMIPEAVTDARENALLNGITNAEFILGTAEETIPGLINTCTCDAIFLDPPRKGCGEALINAIIKAQIKKIIYISCEPATLARDIKIFTENRYNLICVQPIDMFPQTGKIESVLLLTCG